MNLIVKKANANDVKKLTKLFDSYRVFYNQESNLELAEVFLKERVEKDESVIFYVQNEKEEYLGFTQLYPSFSSVSAKSSWILNDLFVDENHRQKGIAKMLMNQATQMAIKSGSKGIFLQTALENKKAQTLYEELGYVKDEEFYSYFLSV
ncbi:N-acetyltransferase [Arcobacter sp. LA11]|uniref:GNAT family N-acetyltransferase n=1 Tax=Arcobacter sp. LA11 TaxID=1898176 RepID=UPI000932DD03|nr:GNAT family N-acetyltransferase [Arcobacter sp. LA11]